MKTDRIKTGIKGFDELIEGGIPKGSKVLIVGSPGTGKTIFGLQFLYNGATEYNEKGLFISLEQKEETIKKQAYQFGWDLNPLIREEKLHLAYMPVTDIYPNIAEVIIKYVREFGIQRLVIDSISTLAINAPVFGPKGDKDMIKLIKEKSNFFTPVIGDFVAKRFIYTFLDELSEIDKECTTILVSEAGENNNYLSRDTISEYVSDGIVYIVFESMGGEFSRSLIIRKMRGTRNNEDVHPLEIAENGLIVHNIDR